MPQTFAEDTAAFTALQERLCGGGDQPPRTDLSHALTGESIDSAERKSSTALPGFPPPTTASAATTATATPTTTSVTTGGAGGAGAFVGGPHPTSVAPLSAGESSTHVERSWTTNGSTSLLTGEGLKLPPRIVSHVSSETGARGSHRPAPFASGPSHSSGALQKRFKILFPMTPTPVSATIADWGESPDNSRMPPYTPTPGETRGGFRNYVSPSNERALDDSVSDDAQRRTPTRFMRSFLRSRNDLTLGEGAESSGRGSSVEPRPPTAHSATVGGAGEVFGSGITEESGSRVGMMGAFACEAFGVTVPSRCPSPGALSHCHSEECGGTGIALPRFCLGGRPLPRQEGASDGAAKKPMRTITPRSGGGARVPFSHGAEDAILCSPEEYGSVGGCQGGFGASHAMSVERAVVATRENGRTRSFSALELSVMSRRRPARRKDSRVAGAKSLPRLDSAGEDISYVPHGEEHEIFSGSASSQMGTSLRYPGSLGEDSAELGATRAPHRRKHAKAASKVPLMQTAASEPMRNSEREKREERLAELEAPGYASVGLTETVEFIFIPQYEAEETIKEQASLGEGGSIPPSPLILPLPVLSPSVGLPSPVAARPTDEDDREGFDVHHPHPPSPVMWTGRVSGASPFSVQSGSEFSTHSGSGSQGMYTSKHQNALNVPLALFGRVAPSYAVDPETEAAEQTGGGEAAPLLAGPPSGGGGVRTPTTVEEPSPAAFLGERRSSPPPLLYTEGIVSLTPLRPRRRPFDTKVMARLRFQAEGGVLVLNTKDEVEHFLTAPVKTADGVEDEDDEGACGCDQGFIIKDYTGSDYSRLNAQQLFRQCRSCGRSPASFLCLHCMDAFCPSHVSGHYTKRPESCTLFLNLTDIMTSFDRIFWCERCERYTWKYTEAFDDLVDHLAYTRGTYWESQPVRDIHCIGYHATLRVPGEEPEEHHDEANLQRALAGVLESPNSHPALATSLPLGEARGGSGQISASDSLNDISHPGSIWPEYRSNNAHHSQNLPPTPIHSALPSPTQLLHAQLPPRCAALPRTTAEPIHLFPPTTQLTQEVVGAPALLPSSAHADPNFLLCSSPVHLAPVLPTSMSGVQYGQRMAASPPPLVLFGGAALPAEAKHFLHHPNHSIHLAEAPSSSSHWLPVGNAVTQLAALGASVRGWRTTQEDAEAAFLVYIPEKAEPHKGVGEEELSASARRGPRRIPMAVFCVFDGHGGDTVAKLAAVHFENHLRRVIEEDAKNAEDPAARALLFKINADSASNLTTHTVPVGSFLDSSSLRNGGSGAGLSIVSSPISVPGSPPHGSFSPPLRLSGYVPLQPSQQQQQQQATASSLPPQLQLYPSCTCGEGTSSTLLHSNNSLRPPIHSSLASPTHHRMSCPVAQCHQLCSPRDRLVVASSGVTHDEMEVLRRYFENVMRASLASLDSYLEQSPEGQRGDYNCMGCTACIVGITSNFILCANVGDSGAAFYTNKEIIPISKTHRITDPVEKQRITEAGYSIQENRIEGLLAVPRALGDFEFKQCGGKSQFEQAVSCAPEVTVWPVPPAALGERWGVVMGCDGVWDTLTKHQVHYALVNTTSDLDVAQSALEAVLTGRELLEKKRRGPVRAMHMPPAGESSGMIHHLTPLAEDFGSVISLPEDNFSVDKESGDAVEEGAVIDPALLTAAAGIFAQCVAPKDNEEGIGMDNCSLILIENRHGKELM